MGYMKRLLNKSLNKFILYSGLVLAISIPVYYWAMNRLWQYEMNEHKIVLTREADREDRLLIIGAVTTLTVLFFIVLIAVLIWVNRRISRSVWNPFYKSLDNIRQFDLTKHKTPAFEKTDITEFEELNQSLGRLIAGNIASYTQQKEFAENASHELQTPLAIVQSKLELLLQSHSLKDEQYVIIDEALKALSRVNRINKNLLLLTKIENSQYMDKEKIDLSILLGLNISHFSNFSQDRQIEITTDIRPAVTVQGNKVLVEILVHNMITNAIRHTPFGGSITIYLDKSRMDFSNTGQLPLQEEQLFKRFTSASTQTPGTGLGLALVKQICNRNKWEIDYSFADQRHTFSIRF
jgi:signal transduction histidine kinase